MCLELLLAKLKMGFWAVQNIVHCTKAEVTSFLTRYSKFLLFQKLMRYAKKKFTFLGSRPKSIRFQWGPRRSERPRSPTLLPHLGMPRGSTIPLGIHSHLEVSHFNIFYSYLKYIHWERIGHFFLAGQVGPTLQI